MWCNATPSTWADICLSIYSRSNKKEIKIFNEGNFLLKIMSDLKKKYCVYQNDDFIAYVLLCQICLRIVDYAKKTISRTMETK